MNLLTAKQAADELGISARLVRRLAVQMSVGERYSTQWLFTAADVDAMRSRNRQRGRTRARTREINLFDWMERRMDADAAERRNQMYASLPGQADAGGESE